MKKFANNKRIVPYRKQTDKSLAEIQKLVSLQTFT